MNDKNKLELQKLIDEINKEAKKVVEDYAKNPWLDSSISKRIRTITRKT